MERTPTPVACRSGLLPDSVRRLPRWGLACGLALLAACSSAPAVNTGPFGGGGDSSSLCVPVGRGGVLSYGLNAFTNTGGTARIERVALTDPHDLRIVAAYVVPVTGNTLYGVLSGYPPARGLPADVQWDRRQRANGAAIPHSRGIQYNLVLVLKHPRVLDRRDDMGRDLTGHPSILLCVGIFVAGEAVVHADENAATGQGVRDGAARLILLPVIAH